MIEPKKVRLTRDGESKDFESLGKACKHIEKVTGLETARAHMSRCMSKGWLCRGFECEQIDS